MTRTTTGLFLVLISLLFIAAQCNSDASSTTDSTMLPNRLSCYVRYVAETNEFKAEAKIKPIDSASTVDIKGSVLFQDQPMPVINIPGFGQRLSKSGRGLLESSYSFNVRYENGASKTYKASIEPIDSFWVDGPIAKSKSFLVHWKGAPLTDDEELTLLISDGKQKALSSTWLGRSNGSSIKIIPPTLKVAHVGKAAMSLVRKKRKAFVEDGRDVGNMMLEYYTEGILFDLVE